jgi:hypothetical protein
MASGRLSLIRIPLILLALGDLALLAMRLRPWNEIVNLPGQGTTGFDPIICLVAYAILLFWIGGNGNPDVQDALMKSMRMAIPAGLLAIGFVYLSDDHSRQGFYLQVGVLALAGVLWGLAGWQGAKVGRSPNLGIAAGVWAAMVSALMAVAVVLARIDLNNPVPQSPDPWKQYQGLAIGNQTVQSLVHSLNMGTGFLLICPLVGGALGLLFAMATQE